MITVIQPHRSMGRYPWPYCSRPCQDFIAVQYRCVPWMLLFLFFYPDLFKGFLLLWLLAWKSFFLWLTPSPLLLFLHQALILVPAMLCTPFEGLEPMMMLTAETGESSDLTLTFSWVLSQDFSRELPLFWPEGKVVEIGETGEGKMTPVAWRWMLQCFLRTYSGFAAVLVSWIRQLQDRWGKGSPSLVTTTSLEGNASKV